MNNRAGSPRRTPWVDLAILAASLLAATWAATRSSVDLQTDLNLVVPRRQVPWAGPPWMGPGPGPGPKPPTLRERYASDYPRSPLAWANRSPSVQAIERRTRDLTAWLRPFLAVASPGVGLVAIRRRAGPKSGRLRSGPGRAAGLIAFLFAGLGLTGEYLLRRFNLARRASVHYDFEGAWQLIAMSTGAAILGAWVILALAGRWRVGRGWREWLGLALGLAWLAAFAWEVALGSMAQLED